MTLPTFFILVLGVLREDPLERDDLLEAAESGHPAGASEVELGHAAGGEAPDQLVATQPCSGGEHLERGTTGAGSGR